MKKRIALVLAALLCLSLCACGNSGECTCDCPQCAQCEKKAEDHGDKGSETAEQNDHVLEFETPVVVAEDQYLRVELVKFREEYRLWKQGYPHNADSDTEGASLEKFAVFKFCNKTDHTMTVRMGDIYLGSDGAEVFNPGSSEDVAAGKNVLGEYLVLTGEKETLKSMEELYALDGAFYIYHIGEDGVLRNGYTLNFSIPDGMNSDNADSASETADLKNSSYLGKWKVTEITFADPYFNSRMEEDAELWEPFFKGMLGSFDNVYFVFTESGDCYYHTDNGTNAGKWKETETGMQAGNIVFVEEDGKLVSEREEYLLFWEKVSDDQTIPEA